MGAKDEADGHPDPRAIPPGWLLPAVAEYVVLFDQDCALCRRTAEWLRRADRRGRLTLVPLQRPGVLAALGLEEAEAVREIQVIDRSGERLAGADGVLRAASRLPGLSWLTLVFRLPGGLAIARLIYRLVARLRRREACAEGCAAGS